MSNDYSVHLIPITDIFADETFNCRGHIPTETIEELAADIDAIGLQSPGLVQPIEEVQDAPPGFKYRLVCGHRRLEAFKLLNYKKFPVFIRRGLSTQEALKENLTENIERENLTVWQEAEVLNRLFKPYRTNSSIAKELHKSEKWVRVRRRLFMLPEWIQMAARSGRLTEDDLHLIQTADDPERVAKSVLRSIRQGKSKRKALEQVGRIKPKKTKQDVKDLMVKLLDMGINPNIIRLLGWSIGEISDEELETSLQWITDKRDWLK